MTHPESESSAPAAWRWWRGARVATMSAQPGSLAWGWLPQGDLLTHGARIAWVGPSSEADAALQQHLSAPERAALDPIDLHGLTVTPGLIDAHTHLVYGGHRAREFELRLQGATYEEIARAGGGIRSTVTATREASDEQLFESALARPLRRLGRTAGGRRRPHARSAGAQPCLVRRGWQRHRHLAPGRCPDVGVAGLVAET